MDGFNKESLLIKEALLGAIARGGLSAAGNTAKFLIKHPVIPVAGAAGGLAVHTVGSADKAFKQKRIMGPQSYAGGISQ